MTADLDTIEAGRWYITMMAAGQTGVQAAHSEGVTLNTFWRAVRMARDADRPPLPAAVPVARINGRAEYTYLTDREVRELHVYRDEIKRADRTAVARENLYAAHALEDLSGI